MPLKIFSGKIRGFAMGHETQPEEVDGERALRVSRTFQTLPLIARVPQKTCELALGCFSFALLAAKPLNVLSCLESWPWPESQGIQGTTIATESEQCMHSSSVFLLPVPARPCRHTPPSSSEKGGGGSLGQWSQHGSSSGPDPHPPN